MGGFNLYIINHLQENRRQISKTSRLISNIWRQFTNIRRQISKTYATIYKHHTLSRIPYSAFGDK